MVSARHTIPAINENILTMGGAGLGRDYTDPATWWAANGGDMVTAQQSEVLEWYDDEVFDVDVVISGATTNATYFPIMRPAPGERHDGTFNTGVRILSTAAGHCIDVQQDYCQIQDLVAGINNNSTTNSRVLSAGEGAGCSHVRFIGCIVSQSLNAGTGTGICLRIDESQPTDDIGVILCIFESGETDNATIAGGVTNVFFYNCTSYGGVNLDDGFDNINAATVTVKNCLGADSPGNDFEGSFTGNNNASGDATAPGTSSRTNQTFTFVDAPNHDFHLDDSDTGARGFGADLSADAVFAFDDDIDGSSVGSWSIGVHSIAAVQGSEGTLSATLGALALSSTGDIALAGTLAETLSAMTASSSGGLAIAGSAASTLGPVTSAATGQFAATGPIGYWTLDNTLADSAGANDLTYSGATPTYEAGQIGNAGVLDGTDWFDTGVTQIGTIGLFAEAAERFSVSCWVKTTSTGTLVAKASGTAANRTFQIAISATNLDVYMRGGIQNVVPSPNDDNWHHVVVTWDGATGQCWLDNVLVEGNLTIGTSPEDTGENITVGARTGGTGYLLDGEIDDLRIYARAIDAAAVNSLFTLQPGEGDVEPPSIPGNLQITQDSADQQTLSWSPSTDDSGGALIYRIESCDGAGCVDFAEVGLTTAAQFAAGGLAFNTLYRYRVRAQDPTLNLSDHSAIVEESTLPSIRRAERQGGTSSGGFSQ